MFSPHHLLLIVLAWICFLQTASASGTTDFELLYKDVGRILCATRTPGAAVALVRNGEIVWTAGVGVANVAAKSQTTTNTLFRLGSASKCIVGLSMLKLQYAGKLDIWDKLSSHAPELRSVNPWERTDPVRLVHLLEHTSGWSDLSLSEFAAEPPISGKLLDALSTLESRRVSRWKPGTWYSYSNVGTGAAAYIIEKVSGEPFEEYVRKTFFEPLGMTSATYAKPKEGLDVAEFYRDDGTTTLPYWDMTLRPAGALSVSARDISLLLQFFARRGESARGQILPASAFDRMQRATTTVSAYEGVPGGYGLTIYSMPTDGFVYFGHDGAVFGGFSEFAYLPASGDGYAFMINSGSSRCVHQLRALLRRQLEQELSRPPPLLVGSVPEAFQAEIRGWFASVTPRSEQMSLTETIGTLTRLEINDSALVLRPLIGPAKRLLAVGPLQFRAISEPVQTVVLLPQKDGAFQFQTVGVDGRTFKQVPNWKMSIAVGATAILLFSAGSSLVCAALSWFGGIGRIYFGQVPPLAGGLLVASVASAVGVLTIFLFAASDGLEIVLRLGRLTPWSLGIFLLGLMFPTCALLALHATLTQRSKYGKAVVWKQAILASMLLACLATALWWSGGIGNPLWM